MWWNNSLRTRLFGTLALGVGLCLAVLFLLFDTLVDRELYRRFDASLTNRARTAALYFGARLDGAAAKSQSLSEFQVLPEFRLGQHREFYQVWDARGTVVARSAASQGTDLQRPYSVGATPQHFDLPLPDGHLGRGVAQVFALPGSDARQSLTVVIAEERDEVDALENTLHTILIVGIVTTLAVILLLTRLTIHRTLRPVERYAGEVATIDTALRRDPPAIGDLPAELLPVARQFSAVLERLTLTLDRERRFSRDVAHELRTPIAEAKALAETALRSDSPVVIRKHLSEIVGAASELESIVGSLLLIARYEAGIEQPQAEPLNLADEIRRQLERIAAAAQTRAVRFRAELPAECWVQSDPILLGRLIANLLDNAVAHAPAASEVLIQLAADPPRLVLTNAAPLLTPAAVAQLGERFVRAPTPAAGQHHAGLGLALCRTIAGALQLTFSLELSPSPDSRLTVSIAGFTPLAAASS